jgi:hypothetical protein
MTRALNLLSVLLLALAAGAFTWGVLCLGDERDLMALYLLLVGGLCLHAATELLRPRGS